MTSTSGLTFFREGSRGEVATYWYGDPSQSLTYSNYYGCKRRIGFSIKLPPNDFRKYDCLEFDGEDDYVEVAHSASLNISTVLTMEAWVKGLEANQKSENIYAIGKTDAWGLGVARGGVDNFSIWLRDSNGDKHIYETGISVLDGFWHHLVITYDGSAFRFYKDSILVDTYTINTDFMQSAYPVYVGTYATTYGHFDGHIALTRIYNRALTESEITQNYNNPVSGYVTDGLVFEFNPFKQGYFSDTVYDQSGNGNHGTIYGATWKWSGWYQSYPSTISATKLKLEVFYDNDGLTTYEFENSTNQYYGLQNWSERWLALFDPNSNEYIYFTMNKRPTGLEIQSDHNEVIRKIRLYCPRCTFIWGQRVTDSNAMSDDDSDSIPNLLDSDYSQSIPNRVKNKFESTDWSG